MITVYMLLENKKKHEDMGAIYYVYMTIVIVSKARNKTNFKHKYKGENHAKQKKLYFGT